MATRLFRLIKSLLILMTVVVLTLIVARAWDSQRGPPLEVWHTHVPDNMQVSQIDKADWAGYLKAEEAVFRDVRAEVIDKVDAQDHTLGNRYYAGSPIYPGNFA